MTSTAPDVSTLVRLTVLRGERRADLAVPGVVPVADLLPEVAGAVSALDAYSVHGGYRLMQADGRQLRPEAGLTAQGVEDGAVLTLQLGVEDDRARVYDDVVEAVADTVESSARPWDRSASRRTALSVSALLLLVAAVALGLQRSSGLPLAATAAALSVLLLAGAAVLARAQHSREAAVVVAWSAVPFAAVAGLSAAPHEPALRLPLALAGAGVLVAGTAGAVAVLDRRVALLPAVIAGAAAAVAGAVLTDPSLRVADVVAFVLVGSVLLASLVPLVAVAVSRVRAAAPRSDAEIAQDPAPIDPKQVAGQVRLGREVLLGLAVSAGALLVLSAPFVVDLGVPGALLGVCAAVVVLLRTRQSRARTDVAVGMLCGVAGLVALVVAACIQHPSWRQSLSGALVALAAVLLAAAVVPRPTNIRLGRLADVAEGVALTALLPLLVVSTGIVAAVRA